MEIKNIIYTPLEIKYEGKKYKIDIKKELEIDENILNEQIRDIPSNYAFLCMLRDRAINKKNLLEAEMNQAYSQAWVYYKEADSRINNDLATNRANVNKKYLSLQKKYLKALDKATTLSSICRAYESRDRLIQTISSNLRKQHQ